MMPEHPDPVRGSVFDVRCSVFLFIGYRRLSIGYERSCVGGLAK
jgi:hypothetical protein